MKDAESMRAMHHKSTVKEGIQDERRVTKMDDEERFKLARLEEE